MEELLARALAGDKYAENQLFDFLLVRFRHFAKQHIRTADVEDLAQEACLTVLEKYKTEKFSKSFQAWAYGVLKMKIGNYLQAAAIKRKNMADGQIDEENTANILRTVDFDLKRRLMNCMKKINKVNPRYTRVLNLVHQGYSTDEISEMLQINRNNYYVILNRGRKMLKACLKTDRIES
jgi:RNA polymerase sigma factor (sigma-70 family)